MEILILIIIIAIGIFVLNSFAGKSLGQKKQCPRCEGYGMKADGGGYYRNGQRGIDWICPHCRNRFFK